MAVFINNNETYLWDGTSFDKPTALLNAQETKDVPKIIDAVIRNPYSINNETVKTTCIHKSFMVTIGFLMMYLNT